MAGSASPPRPAFWTLALVVAVGSARELSGQHEEPRVAVSGEIRLRGEWDARSAGIGDDAVTLSRIRVTVTARAEQWLRAYVQFQDARAWGTEGNTLTDGSADNLDVHQGYLEIGRTGGLTARLGRQEMAFGDERLVGAVGWTNTARAFDGVRAIHHLREGEVHLFWMTVAERDAVATTGTDPQLNEGIDGDGWFLGAFLTSLLGATRLELAALHDRRGLTSESYTASVRAHGKTGDWLYDGTGAYQFGARRRAYMWSARLGRAVGSATVAGQVDYLSGDPDPGDRRLQAFHTLYATNHLFYGLMDYLLAISSVTADGGVLDVVARGSTLLPAGWRARLDLHYLSTTRQRFGRRQLGVEADLVGSQQLARGTTAEVGVGLFAPGRLATVLLPAFAAGRELTYWGYAQLTARWP